MAQEQFTPINQDGTFFESMFSSNDNSVANPFIGPYRKVLRESVTFDQTDFGQLRIINQPIYITQESGGQKIVHTIIQTEKNGPIKILDFNLTTRAYVDHFPAQKQEFQATYQEWDKEDTLADVVNVWIPQKEVD